MEVNDALCRMLGYSREELLQLDFQHITHPDDLAKDLALLQQLLEGVIADYQLEKRYVDKRGNVLWILLSVSLVRDALGYPCTSCHRFRTLRIASRPRNACGNVKNTSAPCWTTSSMPS